MGILRSLAILLLVAGVCADNASADPDKHAKTNVYIVGSGTPAPGPSRAGASVAVVYKDKSFLFDAGDTVMNRLEKLAEEREPLLMPHKLDGLFITHMHSDHTLGYPAVLLSLWWLREDPLKVYGPPGVEKLTEGVLEAYEEDTKIRINTVLKSDGLQRPQPLLDTFSEPGVIYNDGEVSVEAFPVSHGDINPAYGYKVTTPDKVTVISGDTTYDETVAEQAKGADYLIHEVYSEKGLEASSDPSRPQRSAYHTNSHSSVKQVAAIAKIAEPKLLVLSHILNWGDSVENMELKMSKEYNGEFVFAHDAMRLP